MKIIAAAPSPPPRIPVLYSFDDRVTEDIYDIEDERAEVEIIVQGLARDDH